ncbi:hypothetical protein ASD00_33785 [Ensifer sp. Root31]|nr:hypothetical protein ASD00_33785 [Ensifer sp. Root31]
MRAETLQLAIEAADRVVDLIEFRGDELFRVERNHQRLADLVVDAARRRCPDDYCGFAAPLEATYDREQGELNRLFLRTIVIGALNVLQGTPQAEAKLQPWFQRAVLSKLGAILSVAEETQARVMEIHETNTILLARIKTTGTEKRATNAGITQAAVEKLANTVSSDVRSTGQAIGELNRAVDEAIAVQVAKKDRSTDEPSDAIYLRIAALSASGEHAKAAAEVDDALAKWKAQEIARQMKARQAALQLLDMGFQQDALRRDAVSAANRLFSKLVVNNVADDARFDALSDLCRAWQKKGIERGANFDLAITIELARLRLSIAQPDKQAQAKLGLANALFNLGNWESGTLRLREAGRVYVDAIEAWKLLDRPEKVAAAQMGLGNSLRAIGERSGDSDLVVEAIGAFSEALGRWSDLGDREKRAETKEALGVAKELLGWQRNDASLIEEAVACYVDTLDVYRPNGLAIEWAKMQANIGRALSSEAKITKDISVFDRARRYFSEALKVIDADNDAMTWATTQANWASAIAMQADLIGSATLIDEAIEKYQSALKQQSSLNAPFYFADSKSGLGRALVTKSRLQNQPEPLLEAIRQFEEALTIQAMEDLPLDHAETSRRLESARKLYQERFKSKGGVC